MPSNSTSKTIATTTQPRAYTKNNRVFLRTSSRSVSNPVMVGDSFFASHAAVQKHFGARNINALKTTGEKLYGSFTVRDASLAEVQKHVPDVHIMNDTEVEAIYTRVAAKDADVASLATNRVRKHFDAVVWRDGGVTIRHQQDAVPAQHFSAATEVPQALKAVTDFTFIGL